MALAPKNFFQKMLINRWLLWILAAPLFVLLVITTFQYSQIEREYEGKAVRTGSLLVSHETLNKARVLNDFEAFYIVGRLYREGDILKAYNNEYLLQSQERFTSTTTFMPWAYPPYLTALTPLLPLFGLPVSYFLFTFTSMIIYFFVALYFRGEVAGGMILAVYPALVLNVRLGQNGFLTGALVGLFLFLFIERRRGAGLPLGMMAIKPHLGIALGLVALLNRQWRALLIACVSVAAASAAATLALGAGVWPAFFFGVRDAGGYLEHGLYPLYRMSSVYAGVRSFGALPEVAMVVHAAVAIISLSALTIAALSKLPVSRLAALAATVTVLISPYNYDYDLACLGFALGLVLRDLLARLSFLETIGFYICAWVATGSGLAQHFAAVLFAGTTEHPHGSPLNWSFQSAGIVVCLLWAIAALKREPRPSAV